MAWHDASCVFNLLDLTIFTWLLLVDKAARLFSTPAR